MMGNRLSSNVGLKIPVSAVQFRPSAPSSCLHSLFFGYHCHANGDKCITPDDPWAVKSLLV